MYPVDACPARRSSTTILAAFIVRWETRGGFPLRLSCVWTLAYVLFTPPCMLSNRLCVEQACFLSSYVSNRQAFQFFLCNEHPMGKRAANKNGAFNWWNNTSLKSWDPLHPEYRWNYINERCQSFRGRWESFLLQKGFHTLASLSLPFHQGWSDSRRKYMQQARKWAPAW